MATGGIKPDRLMTGNGGGSLEDSLHTELESILREQRNRRVSDREGDLNIYRSGSAPPTIEGALSAVGSLSGRSDFREIGVNRGFTNNGVQSEDEIRANPSYLAYYHSHHKVNPRLPPPLLSNEDGRAARRFQGGGSSSSSGGFGDWRNKDAESSSLFSMQPSFSVQNSDSNLMDLGSASGRNLSNQTSSPWLDRRTHSFVGPSSSGLGARRKSFADILQEGIDRPASMSSFLVRPSSCNDFGDDVESLDDLRNGSQGYGSPIPQTVSSAADYALARSRTPESKLVARLPSPGLPPVGSRVSHVDPKSVSGLDIQGFRSSDIAANLSNLSLSEVINRDVNNYGNLDLDHNHGYNQNFQQGLIEKAYADSVSASYTDLARKNGTVNNVSASKLSPGMHMNFPKRTSSSNNLYSQVGSSGYGGLEGAYSYNRSASNPDIDFLPGAFPANQTRNSAIDTHLDSALTSIQNGQNMNSRGNKSLDSPLSDPRYVQQLLQQTPDYNSNILSDLSLVDNRLGASHGDLNGIQKAYLETFLLNQQREQLELSLLGKSSGLNYDSYGIGAHGSGPIYPGNIMGTGSGNLMYQNDRVSRFNSMMRNSPGRSPGTLNSDIGNNLEGRVVSSLLDEFKNNKIRPFELSDIVGHVVEFSTDQYGSRFIQQKLETASAEEKATIFPEIVPHARTLMTDVFGNYVIQKFFEHGMDSQRKELANQLMCHVLPLSLQMYGCRVIQKALEVVEMDQQTQMVKELDGSVMKCVRDQNGNHVIQKCIECIPQEHIQFIVSAFYGQVIVLSSHPYGCRVIQRVLEHSDDTYTRQVIMDEIMQSVCTLAQDQYGNYVIQHVLQHGEPQERSAIIYKLAGQIVRMSQQKFASNVVEKCLTFGSPEERQILVTEMLGSTEENEPLQAMMKDPFGNYVVQKVLETCNDESLELLLSRIKVHLNTLKRYTYGKHIVSRIEKLIATGERRISLSSTISLS